MAVSVRDALVHVTDVLVHLDPAIVNLTLDEEALETTPEHPFYTRERGWVDAGNLPAVHSPHDRHR